MDKKKVEYDPEFEKYWEERGNSPIIREFLDSLNVHPDCLKMLLYNAWLSGSNAGMQNAIDKMKS